MKYALLLYGDEQVWANATPQEREQEYAEHGEFARMLTERGAARGGEELAATTTATTVRKQDGDVKLVDGPFAETTEQLAGFYLVEAENLDAALELAKALPSDIVEVRPCVPPPDGSDSW